MNEVNSNIEMVVNGDQCRNIELNRTVVNDDSRNGRYRNDGALEAETNSGTLGTFKFRAVNVVHLAK